MWGIIRNMYEKKISFVEAKEELNCGWCCYYCRWWWWLRWRTCWSWWSSRGIKRRRGTFENQMKQKIWWIKNCFQILIYWSYHSKNYPTENNLRSCSYLGMSDCLLCWSGLSASLPARPDLIQFLFLFFSVYVIINMVWLNHTNYYDLCYYAVM